MGFRMLRGDCNAQSRSPFRDRRRTNRLHEVACFQKLFCDLHGPSCFAENDRDNLRLALAGNARRSQLRPQERDVLPKASFGVGIGLDDF